MKLPLCFCVVVCLCLSGCGGNPAEVRRSDFPYLSSNATDTLVYRSDPSYTRQPVGEPMYENDPVRITSKDEIRTVLFWLNETFHNREASTTLNPQFFEGDQSMASSGLLRLETVYGPVEIKVHMKGKFEPQSAYVTDRVMRDRVQSLIDDRYPEEQFYYVDTVLVECQGIVYSTYFFPRLLAPQAGSPKR